MSSQDEHWSEVAPSNRSNKDWGALVEEAACERWSLKDVSDDPSTPHWVDARAEGDVVSQLGMLVVEAGTPVQVKAAAIRVRDQDTVRCGRIWVPQQAHQPLLEADGEYAIGVYDPALPDDQNPVKLAIARASTIDALTTFPCQAATIPWSRVFARETVDDEARARRDQADVDLSISAVPEPFDFEEVSDEV